MPYSAASYRASQKYKKENVKRVPLDMQIAEYEKLKAHTETTGETVNGFVKRSIRETMKSDQKRNGGASHE